MNQQETIHSAALSCMMYVRQQELNDGRVYDRKAVNRMVDKWLDTSERRRIYPRECFRTLRRQIKDIRHFQHVSAKDILAMLIESKGIIYDIANSELRNLTRFRDSLRKSKWIACFGTVQDWQHLPLVGEPVCFGLQSDVQKHFNELGMLIQPLPLMIAGDINIFSQLAAEHSFSVTTLESEAAEGVVVYRCLLAPCGEKEHVCV